MLNPLKGYFNICQAVRWAVVTRDSFEYAREPGDLGPFGGGNERCETARVLRDALECGELRAVGMREEDGVLVTIQPAAWRTLYAQRGRVQRDEEIDAPMHFDTFGTTRVPFDEAHEGRATLVMDKWVMPLVAKADLARWAGEQPPAEPPERPDDWPQNTPARMAPAEAARIWMNGFATSAADAGKIVKRDDKAMTRGCQAATGCTVDEVREAYKGLPENLRNLSPKERQAAKERPLG